MPEEIKYLNKGNAVAMYIHKMMTAKWCEKKKNLLLF
jgi:hypothetical protein